MQIITGESIAEQLTAWGIPCEFIRFEIAPQLINYYFKLYNILQLNKIKKLCDNKNLEVWSGWQFNFTPYQGGFCLQADRKERSYIYIYKITQAN